LEAQKDKATLNKKNNAGSITIPDFNYTIIIFYYFCGTGTKTDLKISGREDPDMNPHSYVHQIFDKGIKKI
jgi:hypothetical protein